MFSIFLPYLCSRIRNSSGVTALAASSPSIPDPSHYKSLRAVPQQAKRQERELTKWLKQEHKNDKKKKAKKKNQKESKERKNVENISKTL
ncbi:MAG: hypothetical protein KBS42_03065 [Bacteroidales bacterium]|nr:hypothetical protein [Candidatus Colicola coprequi]